MEMRTYSSLWNMDHGLSEYSVWAPAHVQNYAPQSLFAADPQIGMRDIVLEKVNAFVQRIPNL